MNFMHLYCNFIQALVLLYCTYGEILELNAFFPRILLGLHFNVVSGIAHI